MSTTGVSETRAVAGPRVSVSLIAAVAAIAGLLFGYDTAVINGALVFLRRQFALSDLGTEFAAGSLLIGCLLGAIGAGGVSDRLGRRMSLLWAALLFAVSSAGAALSQGLLEFSFARVLGGLAIGIASGLTPVYIAEISPQQSRGRLVSLNQLAVVCGILIAYCTNWRLSALGESSWRWMFALGVIPSLAFLLGLMLIPESPRWLLAHRRPQKGREVLESISSPSEVDRLVGEILRETSMESRSIAELYAPALRGRLLVAVLLAVFQQISGINTVLYYGALMFSERFSNAAATAAIGANVLVGAVNLASTIVAMLLIDRVGRRLLLLLSSGGMAICLSLLVLSLRFVWPPAVAFTSILLYVAFFALGLGPVVWVYMAEIFPTNLRGRAMSIASGALWASCLAVTVTFVSIMRAVGLSGAFSLYAVLSLATCMFIWKCVPETRGCSLEEIQRNWKR